MCGKLRFKDWKQDSILGAKKQSLIESSFKSEITVDAIMDPQKKFSKFQQDSSRFFAILVFKQLANSPCQAYTCVTIQLQQKKIESLSFSAQKQQFYFNSQLFQQRQRRETRLIWNWDKNFVSLKWRCVLIKKSNALENYRWGLKSPNAIVRLMKVGAFNKFSFHICRENFWYGGQ